MQKKELLKYILSFSLSISLFSTSVMPIMAMDYKDVDETNVEENETIEEEIIQDDSKEMSNNPIESIQITERENTNKCVQIKVLFKDKPSYEQYLLCVRKDEELLKIPSSYIEEKEIVFEQEFEIGQYTIESLEADETKCILFEDFNQLSFIVEEEKVNDDKEEHYEDILQAIEEAEEQRYENWLLSSSISNEANPNTNQPYWKIINGKRYFYNANDVQYGDGPCVSVIDVSSWQEVIDWNAVKKSGEVDGAIIRLGYGSAKEDDYFRRNIQECERLKIPYGVYLFSYARNADEALLEAKFTNTVLKNANAHPTYPVYYDLEKWSYTVENTVYNSPTTPSVYKSMVQTYVDYLDARGWNTNSYTYRSYLQNECKNSYVWSKTSWIAAYTPVLGIVNSQYTGDFRGWQYTDSDFISGIQGRVDRSAFIDNTRRHERLAGYTLSLSNNIGVNVCMSLSKRILEDAGAYMLFNLPNGTTKKVYVKDATELVVDANTYYQFPCTVSAKEMTSTIKSHLVFSDGTSGDEYSYNVNQYGNYIINNPTKFTEKDVQIAKAMLTYGKYAQLYFGYNTSNVPTKVNALSTYNLDSYKYVLTDNNSSVDFAGARLVLKSRPKLKLYFIGDAEFKVGSNVAQVQKEGKFSVITISNITDFSKMYTITTSDFSLKYSVLSYGIRANELSQTSIYNLIRAMHAYNLLFK